MLPKRHLDLDLLRALVAIAETASFSQAAGALGRSQSTISLQIKRLEQMIGRPLLERVQGRVSGPTEDGRVLIDYARQLLRLNDEAYSCFAEPAMTGTLRVGLPEELMESVFPAALKRFRETHPRVNLIVRCHMSAPLQKELEAGEIDVAIFKSTGAAERDETEVLWREPLTWIAAEDYPRALPASLPLVVFAEGCAFRTAATAALARAGQPWHIAFSGNSYTGLRHAVACGLGFTVLPLSLTDAGAVVARHDLPPLPDSHVVVRYAPGERHPAALRLIEVLKDRLAHRTRRAAASG
jgi:molybdate transport repressor ModE-like protein